MMRRPVIAGLMAIATLIALAACTGNQDAGRPGRTALPSAGSTSATVSPTASVATTPPDPPLAPLTLKISPAAGATGVPVSAEIGIALSIGSARSVVLTTGGARVAGSLRADRTSWIPSAPLAYGQSYSATVLAGDSNGRTVTARSTFTTMNRPGNAIGSGLYLFDGQTYGVAMPIVAEFFPGIAPADRAAVQKRLFVTTSPAQPGTWRWVGDGSQAYYRGPAYWQPGTVVTVRLGLEGLPLSSGKFGDVDRRATATIGPRFEMTVDNATKQMTVRENGVVTRKMPVSLGKPSTPSSSGTMVVMDRQYKTVFDTTDEPDGYRVDIEYAQRLTWKGEYIHSAPWSEGDQGVRNVSHGCVNLSAANAQWLFERTKVGDPVTVTGTERVVVEGNGWTAWNMTWAEFKKGSALPV